MSCDPAPSSAPCPGIERLRTPCNSPPQPPQGSRDSLGVLKSPFVDRVKRHLLHVEGCPPLLGTTKDAEVAAITRAKANYLISRDDRSGDE